MKTKMKQLGTGMLGSHIHTHTHEHNVLDAGLTTIDVVNLCIDSPDQFGSVRFGLAWLVLVFCCVVFGQKLYL